MRLKSVGDWLSKNGDSIYATRARTIQVPDYVMSTRKGEVHFVHVLDYISDCVSFHNLPENITTAVLVEDNSPVKMARDYSRDILTIPSGHRNEFNIVVRLA